MKMGTYNNITLHVTSCSTTLTIKIAESHDVTHITLSFWCVNLKQISCQIYIGQIGQSICKS